MSRMKDLVIDICGKYHNGMNIQQIQEAFPEYNRFMTERYIINTLIIWYHVIYEDELPKD